MINVKSRTLCVLVTLSLALAPSFVLAERGATADLEGRLFESDFSTPAAGLDVSLIPEDGEKPLATTQTDEKGGFSLSAPEGAYVLLFATEDGTPRAARRVVAEPGVRRQLTLAIPPVAPAQTEEGEGGGSWISTPTGATITMVVAAVALAIAVDEIVDDDESEPDLSPESFPPGDE
jgi:hypothetical protein